MSRARRHALRRPRHAAAAAGSSAAPSEPTKPTKRGARTAAELAARLACWQCLPPSEVDAPEPGGRRGPKVSREAALAALANAEAEQMSRLAELCVPAPFMFMLSSAPGANGGAAAVARR